MPCSVQPNGGAAAAIVRWPSWPGLDDPPPLRRRTLAAAHVLRDYCVGRDRGIGGRSRRRQVLLSDRRAPAAAVVVVRGRVREEMVVARFRTVDGYPNADSVQEARPEALFRPVVLCVATETTRARDPTVRF